MSRAGTSTLAELEAVLRELRSYSTLTERAPGVFDLGPRHYLHFHTDPSGIVADVFLAAGRVRVPATTDVEQAELLAMVAESLAGPERRAGTSRTKRRRRSPTGP